MATHVVFVAAFLLAASWQGPRYSVSAHSISDMYAEGAPHAAFLMVVNTWCGAAGLDGLFERLVAGFGATGVIALGAAVHRVCA
ncbi:hypothetical protein OG896_27495 [Streptomyces sp. NBC_00669]|uniref:hypothetical protein n=1 Tax=Streptomyces sp. NBC_00669 TaxID=2976011 RepID=UPI002E376451|nr:hypothetical protein [Streptomyces sp. NBC_00669]